VRCRSSSLVEQFDTGSKDASAGLRHADAGARVWQDGPSPVRSRRNRHVRSRVGCGAFSDATARPVDATDHRRGGGASRLRPLVHKPNDDQPLPDGLSDLVRRAGGLEVAFKTMTRGFESLIESGDRVVLSCRMGGRQVGPLATLGRGVGTDRPSDHPARWPNHRLHDGRRRARRTGRGRRSQSD